MQKMPIVKHRLDQMCRLFLYVCIQKPVALWSGKQIFNLIFLPTLWNHIKVNLKNERETILEKKKNVE